MKQSQLFTKTQKNAPKDEMSKNAQLLIKGGYINKEMAGVYSFLPLGLRVIENIKQVIREELNKVGANEMCMTALQNKEKWEKTDRWRDDLDGGIWFKTKLNSGSELGLAFTHEEALTNIVKDHVNSYKDLPLHIYQFQTKFRNELRAKAGLMRGREFIMKDLYDFSLDKEQHEDFYEKMKGVYMNIFERLGIGDRTFLTISNGGTFSKYSFEFQTICDAGEDVLLYDKDKNIAINKDDFNDQVFADFKLKKEDYDFKEVKSAEVGDIYSLGEKYAKAIGLSYKDKEGKEKTPYMGSYGIGVPRVMGVIAEIFSDEKGIIWPESVAPFLVHLINIGEEEKTQDLYEKMQKQGIEVLWDERDKRPGEKFADADLIGIPNRVVVSGKSIESGGVEFKKRSEAEGKIITEDDLFKILKK